DENRHCLRYEAGEQDAVSLAWRRKAAEQRDQRAEGGKADQMSERRQIDKRQGDGSRQAGLNPRQRRDMKMRLRTELEAALERPRVKKMSCSVPATHMGRRGVVRLVVHWRSCVA